MSRRRVLVTGAGGFVGRALTLGFARLGWSVIGLDHAFGHRPEEARLETVEGLAAEIQFLRDDLAEGVPDAVGTVDLVIHAAWVTTDPEALGVSAAEYLSLNLRPLMAVLAYAARVRPPDFVFLSSSGVFSPEDGSDGLTDADQPTGTSPYAVAKRVSELLVPSAVEPATAAHVVRLGYLFGPGEVARPSRARVSPVGGWLAAASERRPLEVRSDDPTRDWTFTPDLAGALDRIVGAEPAGCPVHLASPHVRRDRVMAEHIASTVGGLDVITVPTAGPMKPPMVPSKLPALEGFPWTDPASGVAALMASGMAA